MPHYITSHNAEGKAIFTTKIPETAQISVETPLATLQYIYTNHVAKPNVSTEDDLEKYSVHREKGLEPGTIVPPAGFAYVICTFKPNITAPLHRTMTVDTLMMLEGDIEARLDSGETRILHAGDTIVQRATMHGWKNVTPNDGVARFFATSVPVEEPFVIAGVELGAEMRKGE